LEAAEQCSCRRPYTLGSAYAESQETQKARSKGKNSRISLSFQRIFFNLDPVKIQEVKVDMTMSRD